MIDCAIGFQNRGDFYKSAYMTLLSCFKNTSESIRMHMVIDESVKPFIHYFQDLCAEHGHALFLHDAPDIPADIIALFRNNSIDTYSAGCLYRLYMHELIDVDKLVYFDCDIIFERDIAELYNLEIGEAYAIATHDPARKWSRHKASYYLKKLNIDKHRYFNSGVMVLNLKKIRQDSHAGNVFWKYYHELYSRVPHLSYPLYDQDLLNAMLSRDLEKLILTEPGFNYEVCLFARRFSPFGELDGKILHFAALKPWSKFFPVHLHYWKYHAQSPWKQETFSRISDRFFDRTDRRMRALMFMWRHPACFDWLYALLDSRAGRRLLGLFQSTEE